MSSFGAKNGYNTKIIRIFAAELRSCLAISCRTGCDAEERSETFAPSTLETAVALKGDPSPGTTVSSALFWLLLLATRLGSLTSKASGTKRVL